MNPFFSYLTSTCTLSVSKPIIQRQFFICYFYWLYWYESSNINLYAKKWDSNRSSCKVKTTKSSLQSMNCRLTLPNHLIDQRCISRQSNIGRIKCFYNVFCMQMIRRKMMVKSMENSLNAKLLLDIMKKEKPVTFISKFYCTNYWSRKI